MAFLILTNQRPDIISAREACYKFRLDLAARFEDQQSGQEWYVYSCHILHKGLVGQFMKIFPCIVYDRNAFTTTN